MKKLLPFCWLAVASLLCAQTPNPPPQAQPPPPVAIPGTVPIPPAPAVPPIPTIPQIPPGEAPKVITKENTVYVPFEKLEEVFEGQEQGVFLPYREFLEMWNKLNLPEKLKKTEPPVSGVLAGASYSGKVTGDVAEIQAKLNFEALKEGWSSLKIGGDLALANAKTNALLNAAADGQEIIFSQKGSYTLEGTVFGRIVRDKGKATLALKLPRTAVSQFELQLPDKALEFVVTPASAFSATENDGGTKLAVYFGASQEVTISWTKRGGETALPPLLFADVRAEVRLGAGAVHTTASVNYRILRAGVSALDLVVPEDQQVLSVEGQNIKEWKATPGAGGQTIHVDLHTPAKDVYGLFLNLEAPLPPLPQKVKLPVIAAQKVERQSGAVTVKADSDIVVEPADLQGLTQQAVPAVPNPTEPPRETVASYRYLRLPYAGTLNATEAQAQIEVASRTALVVGLDSLKLTADFVYSVKKAGLFSVQIELPAGYPNAEAKGEAVETSSVATVEGKPVLTVKFKQRQTGRIAFQVTGEGTRAKVDEPVTAPALRPIGVERHDAKVGVAIHTSFKANTTEKGDFIVEDIRNLDGLAVADPATPLTLGFRYRAPGGKVVAPAKISFELRNPRVSAEVLAVVDVREALTRYEWTVNYNVEFAGVSEFTLEVPKAIADDLKIDGGQIRERIKTEAAAGGKPGTVQWRVVMQDKILGEHPLKLTYEATRAEQAANAALSVDVPEIKAIGVFRETGQMAVLKDGNLEFGDQKTIGLESMDPKELAPQLRRDGVILAYKYSQHPVALTLGVKKNAYLDVPALVVTYAALRSVIAEDEAETTEVVLHVKNNSQQFFSIQLPARGGNSAKLLSDAFVNGEAQQPSKRPDKNEMLIRLPAKAAASEEFAVRFVYEVPSPQPGKKLSWSGSFDLEPPVFSGVKVMQTKWTVYLPQDHRYLGFGGAMREDLGERELRFPQSLWGGDRRGAGLGAAEVSEPPELKAKASTGFDAPLRVEGQRFELRRMEAPATVTVSYRGTTYAFLCRAFAWLVAFGVGIWLWLRKTREHRWAYFIGVGLGALAIAGAVNPRSAGVWQAISGGVMAAAVVWVSCAIVCGLRAASERREARAAQAAAAEFAAAAARATAAREAHAAAQAAAESGTAAGSETPASGGTPPDGTPPEKPNPTGNEPH